MHSKSCSNRRRLPRPAPPRPPPTHLCACQACAPHDAQPVLQQLLDQVKPAARQTTAVDASAQGGGGGEGGKAQCRKCDSCSCSCSCCPPACRPACLILLPACHAQAAAAWLPACHCCCTPVKVEQHDQPVLHLAGISQLQQNMGAAAVAGPAPRSAAVQATTQAHRLPLSGAFNQQQLFQPPCSPF